MKIELNIKDKQAIDILKSIPKNEINNKIEKYIIIGNMVVSQAEVNTSRETVENFFAPLRSDIEMIREQLKLIVPTMSTSSSKGNVAEKNIIKSFEEHFMDDSFEDVSTIGKCADIIAKTTKTNSDVLIELKDYTGKVPTQEVEKFWRDMERRNTKYGIFISMRSRISKISSCLKLETNSNKTAIFVVNNELNWSGHLFAFYIIKKIIELEATKKKELKGQDLSKVITKLNNFLIEIQNDTKLIEEIQNIADSVQTTTSNRLGKLIDLANIYKRRLDEKIKDAFEEIQKAEIK